MKTPTDNQLLTPSELSLLQPAPLSDADIAKLYRQEPLPPNQGLMLPANEEIENAEY